MTEKITRSIFEHTHFFYLGLIVKHLDGVDSEDDLYDDQREFVVS